MKVTKVLKELEKAAKVYWNAKDQLPPWMVKIDITSYALKVRECPQILFLRRNRILRREQQIQMKDQLAEMIAHFYYKARKPTWMTIAPS